MSQMLPLFIAVPLLGAALSLIFIKSRSVQRVISLACSTAVTAMAMSLIIHVDRNGTEVSSLGGWRPDIAINLVADRFAAIMLTISTTMLLADFLY